MAEQPRKIKANGEPNRGKPVRIKGKRAVSKPNLKNSGVSNSPRLRKRLPDPTPDLPPVKEQGGLGVPSGDRGGRSALQNRRLGTLFA